MSLDLSQSRSVWWDGQTWSDRSARISLSRDEVASLAASVSALPAGYFVAMASNETGRSPNQRDIDFNTDGSQRAVTFGLFQIGAEELSDYGVGGDVMALLDAGQSVRAFSIISSSRLAQIRQAAPNASDRDQFAYLAWSHNYGISTVLKSISKYGCDWEVAKERNINNDHFTGRLVPYVERVLDAIDGDTGSIITDLFSADSMPKPDSNSVDDDFVPADIAATNFGGFQAADGAPILLVALLVGAAIILLGGLPL